MGYKYKRIRISPTETRDEHRMIMEEYLGRRLDFNEVVHHIDDNPRNNSIDNLELMTRATHGKHHGSTPWAAIEASAKNRIGKPGTTRKWTDDQVREIRESYKAWEGSLRAFSRKYMTYHSSIKNIIDGTSYPYVT